MLSQKYNELVMNMIKGDRASLARIISLIEMGNPEIPRIMDTISQYCHNSYRIGITGLPGAGKSTLIDRLITCYRKNDSTVGVIAVDPSSSITGGAILGDRIRMQQHYLDKGVFIRSMATRGFYGGLSEAVDNSVKLMEAFKKDIIFVETTGVGQTETDIIHIADLVVMVLVPGFGDSIQLMKAGLLEIADIIVVNKADREDTDIILNEIRNIHTYSQRKTEQTLITTAAADNMGITDLFAEIEKRRKKSTLTV